MSYAIVGMSHSIKHQVGAVNRPALQLLSSCNLWNKHCFKRSNLTLALSSALSIATLISASQSVTLVIILWSLANKNRQTLLICSCSYGWHPSEVFTLITNYIEPFSVTPFEFIFITSNFNTENAFFCRWIRRAAVQQQGNNEKEFAFGWRVCVILRWHIKALPQPNNRFI